MKDYVLCVSVYPEPESNVDRLIPSVGGMVSR